MKNNDSNDNNNNDKDNDNNNDNFRTIAMSRLSVVRRKIVKGVGFMEFTRWPQPH